MMQPVDIKSQNFGTGLLGYKKTDVSTYVDTVYRAYDELFEENKKLREENDKLNKVIEENRLKIFNLENGGSGVNTADAEKRKRDIIAEAEKAAADIIAKARKTAGEKSNDVFDDIKFDEPKKEEPKAETAASKFFKSTEDSAATVADGDDDVFVGEIEDNRKPNKVMIGDGEEEGADDFEFL